MTTGIKEYKYFFSDEFSPGEENLTTCQSIKGKDAKFEQGTFPRKLFFIVNEKK